MNVTLMRRFKAQAKDWTTEPFVPLVMPGARAPHVEADAKVTDQVFFSRPAANAREKSSSLPNRKHQSKRAIRPKG